MFDLLVVFAVFLLVLRYALSWAHPKGFAPGPRLPLPVVGDAYRFGNDLFGGIDSLQSRYGNVVGFWLGSQRCIAVFDHEILVNILSKSEFSDRQQTKAGPIIRRGTSYGSVPGVLFSNGATWVETRRFSLHSLRDFGFGKNVLEEMIDEEVDNLIKHIDDNFVNQPIDVRQLFNISVLASLWRIISGECLKVDDPKLLHLVTNVQKLTNEIGNPFLAVALNHVWILKLAQKFTTVTFLEGSSKLFDFCSQLLNDQKSRPIDLDNPYTFTEAFLGKIKTATDESSPFYGKLGELNLMNVLMDFFLAGSDTTSNTLNWAMLFMLKNPEVQAKVREELKDLNIGLHRKVSMAEKHLTPYTEAVIHEIQRRGNILPGAVFHQTREETEVDGYKIPAGTGVVPMIGAIMHNPETFPDPFTFDPERYLSQADDGKLKFTPHPHVIPFGTGKRRCLGEILARTSLYKFFTALVQKYDIVSGQTDPISEKPNLGFTKNPERYRLIFRPINKA